MKILDILTILLLLSASALCIYLIYFLKNFISSLKEIERNIKDFNSKVTPLLESYTELSKNLNSISESAKEQVNVSKNIVYEVKSRVDKILELEEKVRGGIEEPVYSLINNLSAISNGVNAFWKTLKQK